MLLKADLRGLILQACHLKGLHDDLIMVASRARLTVVVKADHLDSLRFVWFTWLVVKLVLDRDLSAGSKLLYELTGRVG